MRDIRTEILEQLSAIRKESDLTAAELASKMGLAPTSGSTVIKRVVRGKTKIENLDLYAQALGVDIIYSARMILPDGTEITVSGYIDQKD